MARSISRYKGAPDGLPRTSVLLRRDLRAVLALGAAFLPATGIRIRSVAQSTLTTSLVALEREAPTPKSPYDDECDKLSVEELKQRSWDYHYRAGNMTILDSKFNTSREWQELRTHSQTIWDCYLAKQADTGTLSYTSKDAAFVADGCTLMRRNATEAANCMAGKTIFWIGDSLDSVFYHTLSRVLGIRSMRNKTKEQAVRGCKTVKDCRENPNKKRLKRDLSQMISDSHDIPGGGTLSLIPFVSCDIDDFKTIYAAHPDVLVLHAYEWMRQDSDNVAINCIRYLSDFLSHNQHHTKTHSIWRGPICSSGVSGNMTKQWGRNSSKQDFDHTAKQMMHDAGASIVDAYDLSCSYKRPDDFEWKTSDSFHLAVGSAIPATLAQLVLTAFCPAPPGAGGFCTGDRIQGRWVKEKPVVTNVHPEHSTISMLMSYVTSVLSRAWLPNYLPKPTVHWDKPKFTLKF
eukprot:gnl/TRDRNA2_/TRDRNA2_173301_c3_seq1.p1 gnl/TRDRNA2_/TRDRNA2_173301_c3~~gnl/TRDRNA2_/TRDRNA2_173301_c3_seq1.p1  ORF type:complete len:460 (+),score=28.22 gnl/TRDRNA2_/TRDRNA2_173301_c3_seq1:19-1398(+)